MTLRKKIIVWGGGAVILLLILLVVANILAGIMRSRRGYVEADYGGGVSRFATSSGLSLSKSSGYFSTMRESASPATGGGSVPQAPQKLDRMIIKSGRLSLVVANVRESVAAIQKLVEERGGFVISSDVSGQDANVSGSVTVRIPAKVFDETVQGVKGVAKKVTNEYVTGEDVTEEYHDVQAELKNLEAEEQQFLTILKDAQNIPDILSVTREVARVRGDIDRLKGRIQYLERSVTMATITVHLATDEASLPVIEENQWRPLVAAKNALRGLTRTLKALSYFIIWITVFGAIWVPLVVLVHFGRRWWRSRKQSPFGR